MASPRGASGRWHWAAVVVLLAVHYGLAVSALARKCVTSDEIIHQTAGLCYWLYGDYRYQPENGQLPQRLAALSLIFNGRGWAGQFPEAWAKLNHWEAGRLIYYEMGLPLDRILLEGRAIMGVVSVLIGLSVCLWSRRLFGPGGGLLSLWLYAFSPTMLAHGSLMTSDATLALTLLGSTGAVWVLMHRLTPARLAGACLLVGALFLSKMTAPLILPITGAMLAVRLARGLPMRAAGRVVTGRLAQAGLLAGAAAVVTAATVAMVWGAYGFRYSAFSAQPGNFEVDWPGVLVTDDAVTQACEFIRERRWLPEAFVYGYARVDLGERRRAFFNGEYSLVGWRWFFPYAFLVKTPLETQLILLLAAGAVAYGWGVGRRVPWGRVYEATPLLTLVAVVGTAAVLSRLNIGQRHLLPIYPALFILAGAAGRWVRRETVVAGGVVVIACVGLMVESLMIYPSYLAYFNVIAGGPANGYRHLVDSSLDWGQDLPGLRKWIDERGLDKPGATPVYLSYFGNGRPEYYGIHAVILPGSPDYCEVVPRPWAGGVYCVSATLLESVYLTYIGKWCEPYEARYQADRQAVAPLLGFRGNNEGLKAYIAQRGWAYWRGLIIEYNQLRMARLAAYLRGRTPDDNVGYSILIYKLTDREVLDALEGPPVERYASPTVNNGPHRAE